jgi:hypothetical protein
METQNEKIDRRHVTEKVDKTQEQQLLGRYRMNILSKVKLPWWKHQVILMIYFLTVF